MPVLQEFAFGAYVIEAVFLGETAAFALGDGTIRRMTGDAPVETRAHPETILAATRTADGRSLLTASDDGVVARTDADGTVTRAAEGPGKWISSLAAGPGGALACAAGRRIVARLGDGRERSFELPRAVGGLAFAPKGLRLAAARYDGVTLWWVGTEGAPVSLEWKGAHLGVEFSPDGKYLVTILQENALHGWRLGDGKDMRMSGYPAKPRSLSWSVKGRFLATSGANAAILWPFHFKDGPMGKQPLQLGAREALVTRVACHPSEEMVAVGYADGMVLAIRFSDAKEALLRRADDGPISALSWDVAGRRLAFGTEKGAAGIAGI